MITSRSKCRPWNNSSTLNSLLIPAFSAKGLQRNRYRYLHQSPDEYVTHA